MRRTFEAILARPGVAAWDGATIFDWYVVRSASFDTMRGEDTVDADVADTWFVPHDFDRSPAPTAAR